jgi:cysteine desulfurase
MILGAKIKRFGRLRDDMQQRAYLDWNATAPLSAAAREAVTAVLDVVGNPSSVHAEGRAARHLIEQARTEVAALVGAEPRHVTFTSGGTEANALVLTPFIEVAGDTRPFDRLLMSAVEHPSVRSGHRFPLPAVEQLPVDANGSLDLQALEARLQALVKAGERAVVSVMHANNETGVIQPIPAVAALVHAHGGLLHVDAVQSAGKISFTINDLGADLLTLSGHKLGAPKGVGALVKKVTALHATPLIRGGGQERGLRAGTENVLGIVGFGAAAKAAREAVAATAALSGLRATLEAGLRAASPDVVVFGAESERLPNTTLFARPGAKAETVLIALDLAGIAVSSGAACSSGKVAPSHVLSAMGVPGELASGAIRVSLGATTTEAEIDLFLSAWRKVIMALSRGGRGLAA